MRCAYLHLRGLTFSAVVGLDKRNSEVHWPQAGRGSWHARFTTATFLPRSRGLADLLALQPNMDIRLHIVAPDERREKVFREMLRPVFSLLDRGPLSNTCTFVSYESVDAISELKHLAHISETVFADYEEPAEAEEL